MLFQAAPALTEEMEEVTAKAVKAAVDGKYENSYAIGQVDDYRHCFEEVRGEGDARSLQKQQIQSLRSEVL